MSRPAVGVSPQWAVGSGDKRQQPKRQQADHEIEQEHPAVPVTDGGAEQVLQLGLVVIDLGQVGLHGLVEGVRYPVPEGVQLGDRVLEFERHRIEFAHSG